MTKFLAMPFSNDPKLNSTSIKSLGERESGSEKLNYTVIYEGSKLIIRFEYN